MLGVVGAATLLAVVYRQQTRRRRRGADSTDASMAQRSPLPKRDRRSIYTTQFSDVLEERGEPLGLLGPSFANCHRQQEIVDKKQNTLATNGRRTYSMADGP